EETVTVASPAGKDTVFLYPTDRAVKAGDVSLDGRAGVVSRSAATTTIHLLEGRALQVADGPGVRGSGPVVLAASGAGSLEISTEGEARELQVILPRGIRGELVRGQGIHLQRVEGGILTLRVAEGSCRGWLK